MTNKFIYILLISFTFLACEEIMDGRGHNGNKDHALVKIMNNMSEKMDKMTMTMDPDHDFAMMMIEHHKGAIEMADYELKYGKDSEMKAMAKVMKEMQQEENAKLEAFMADHEMKADDNDGKAFMEAAMRAMDKMDFRVSMQYLNDNIDHDFAALMIHHHKSAVEMAEAEIEYGHEEKMIEMAKEMKEDQLNEIKELQEWLQKH